jgi:hypothetical protein
VGGLDRGRAVSRSCQRCGLVVSEQDDRESGDKHRDRDRESQSHVPESQPHPREHAAGFPPAVEIRLLGPGSIRPGDLVLVLKLAPHVLDRRGVACRDGISGAQPRQEIRHFVASVGRRGMSLSRLV